MSDFYDTSNKSKKSSQDNKSKVTAETYGALDASQADDECWMVRIPPSLALAWDKVATGNILGELVFTKGDGKKLKPTINVEVAPSCMEASQQVQENDDDDDDEDNDDEEAEKGSNQPELSRLQKKQQHKFQQQQKVKQKVDRVPLSYSIAGLSKKIPTYHPVIRDSSTGSVTIWGTVSRTANMQVEQTDKNYRRQLRDRLLATNVNSNRFVKPVDAPQSVITKQQQQASSTRYRRGLMAMQQAESNTGDTSEINKNFSSAVSQYGKKRTADQAAMIAIAAANMDASNDQDKKRPKHFSSDQPIRSVVFQLFEHQKFWAVKDLKNAAAQGGVLITKRSEGEIRDVLREIGEYHRSGDYKTMWELKEEFQQQSL